MMWSGSLSIASHWQSSISPDLKFEKNTYTNTNSSPTIQLPYEADNTDSLFQQRLSYSRLTLELPQAKCSGSESPVFFLLGWLWLDRSTSS